VQEAIRGVFSRELLRSHLRHCARAALPAKTDAAEETIDELVELFQRYRR